MDANQDGEITLAEVTEGERQRRGDEFSEERVQRMFDLFDENKDGVISRQEFVDGFEKYQEFCKESAKPTVSGRSARWLAVATMATLATPREKL